MAGTRKLEKFTHDVQPSSRPSGTRRLDRFAVPTPVEAIHPATLAAAMPSVPPAYLDEPAEELPVLASAIVAAMDEELDGEPYVPALAAPDPDHADQRRPSSAPRALDREPGIERLRTRLARKFTTVADEVTASFAELQIGAGAWQPELTAPEGMSTRDGSRGALHLRLRPRRQGHHVLVGGFVDPQGKKAELRTYQAMVAAHDERIGDAQAIGFSEAEWEQFLRRAEVVLRAVGIVAKRVNPTTRGRRRRTKRFSNTTLAAAALGFLAPSAAVVIWRVLAVFWH